MPTEATSERGPGRERGRGGGLLRIKRARINDPRPCNFYNAGSERRIGGGGGGGGSVKIYHSKLHGFLYSVLALAVRARTGADLETGVLPFTY